VVSLDDHQVVDAGAAQRHRRSKTTEPGSDDRYLR
jgi:hypothetical protein